MKATRNIADCKPRSQNSLLRKIANIFTHPAMGNFTHSGPGSLATGQGGAYLYRAREIENRGSVAHSICACQDECRYPEAASPEVCRDFAFSAEF